MATYHPSIVAEAIIRIAEERQCDDLSNMKLQKLLYYAQSAHLAMFNEPLFDEPVLAWTHGPVVRSVWEKYTGSGSEPLSPDKSIDMTSAMTDEDFNCLTQVFDYFGEYSPWALRNKTHNETPWQDTPRNCEIPCEAMRTYFNAAYM